MGTSYYESRLVRLYLTNEQLKEQAEEITDELYINGIIYSQETAFDSKVKK